MKTTSIRTLIVGVILVLLAQVSGLGNVGLIGATGTLVMTPATLEAGETVTVSGVGLAPAERFDAFVQTPYGQSLTLITAGQGGSTITVKMATNAGAYAADGTGAFTFTLSTAANYQPGEWLVRVRGVDSDQELLGQFAVTALPVATTTLTPPLTPEVTPVTPPARTTPVGEVGTPTAAPAATPMPAVPTEAPAPATTPVPPTPSAATPAPASSSTPGSAPAPSSTPSPVATPPTAATPVPGTSPAASPSATPSPTPAPSSAPAGSFAPVPSPSVAPQPTTIGPGVQVTVTAVANLRAAPSVGAAVVASLPAGTVLTVTGESTTADEYVWWPVQGNNLAGWVVADLLALGGEPTPATASAAPSAAASIPPYSNPGVDQGNAPAVPIVPPPIDSPAVAPAQLLPTFAAASAKTGVPQEILLAIARVESNFTPNAVGPFIPQLAGTEDEHALGMMQFLPSTYRMVMQRVDAATGKNLGIQGIWDAESSIYAAAFYLQDSGAPSNIRRALFSYNNADWYVELVLAWANHYLGGAIPDPNLLDPSRLAGTPLAAPQNPLLPTNSRHLDMAAPIQLYAPWTAGETWYVGGDGSFYGDGYHTDQLGNYYTVDFNRGSWPNNAQDDDGAPILAAADGIVNNIYQDGAGAWVVELYHVAPDGSQLRTLYVHLKMDPRINPGIKVNQPVLHGTVIGLNGSTGNSTGAHLHFGVWLLRDGQWMSVRPEPMEGQYLHNGLSIVSTNQPIATDTGNRALDFGFSPAGPSNADLVTVNAVGQPDGLAMARVDLFVNSAPDGSDRGQWLPVGYIEGSSGQLGWHTAPVAAGTYRILLVQTDLAGNRSFHGLTNETAIRYTIRRGEPRAIVVTNPRTDLAALIPLNGATLPALGQDTPIVSGPLRFAAPGTQEQKGQLGTGAVVAATGAPPTNVVREAAGLLVEEPTTNLALNPSFERGAEGWNVSNPAAVAPSDSALFGKHSLRIDNSKGTAPITVAISAGDGNLTTWSIYARAVTGEPVGTVTLAMAGIAPQAHSLTADWQRFVLSGATGAAGNERQLIIPVGTVVEVDGAQVEAKPYPTSYTDGSLGAGYGWDRAIENGISGRLSTMVQLPLGGLVHEQQGAVAFWATPYGPVADGAVVFALSNQLALTVTGEQANLRWGDQVIGTVPWTQGSTHHYALLWQQSQLTFLYDGQVVTQRDLPGFSVPAETNLLLGANAAGGQVINAIYQDLAVWPTSPGEQTIGAIATAGQLIKPGNTTTVTLNIALALATQGLTPTGITMQISFDGHTWSEVEPFVPTKEVVLPAQAGQQRIYVRFIDSNGQTIVVTDQVDVTLPLPAAE